MGVRSTSNKACRLNKQGDLHPGNVFISRDGKKFIVLDVGIVTEYSDDDHSKIVGILSGFVRKDGRSSGVLMIDDSNKRLQASNANEAAINEDHFIDKMEALTIKASGKDYFMEHLGTYISHICSVAAQHHVMINPAFITAALAVKVQEGIALALDPGMFYGPITSLLFGVLLMLTTRMSLLFCVLTCVCPSHRCGNLARGYSHHSGVRK